ncbi:dTDP-4-dehydrorhamnose reductase [Oenococcus oeni]|nr:dTDP-4-dehydrorhamnose reductase [Oenococcus oeni]SYW05771.1 dTDP-4-dehydrorhamnose reductase [Oenococcus oeni]SYW11383.1 dTDP-4-dehydrorhamnose reductase [Oenococcus oeni]SYW13311.1 dTDP-4-dehydrorhamnose reductase [Oenococcus oeni]SYW14382.1 dTDP-4-dehydrorhamnose reductase [Oenococcus oeni]SYW16967.1 dTDP-4-dehydrorhamnose reductase [Oenococcus oeni]
MIRNMKYMITGANGQLGQELHELLEDRGLDFVAYDSKTLDITNRQLVFEAIEAQKPDVVLDAAAYTKVDAAEDEGKQINWQVNRDGSKNLAQAAKAFASKLVYISTDYVFDGTSSDEYSENDPTNPKNEYGKAKLAGEKAILDAAVDAYIIRTSWVFGKYGNNFVYTMQKLAKTHPKLTVVNDQVGRPTWTKTLAEFILYLIDHQAAYGTYNLSNRGTASWYDFAKEILNNYSLEIKAVNSDQFPQKAYRPRHSVLSLKKAQQTGFIIPTWQEALKMSGMIDK